MTYDFMDVLIPHAQIQARVAELGAQISADYSGKDLTVIGILKGSVLFMADLIRAISMPLAIDFMAVTSYGASTTSSGNVRILKDLDSSITGRHLLIVEDIIDSGLTMQYLLNNLASRGAASLRVCTLLDKPDRCPRGLHRLCRAQRICGGLWAGLQPDVPQSPGYRCSAPGNLHKSRGITVGILSVQWYNTILSVSLCGCAQIEARVQNWEELWFE